MNDPPRPKGEPVPEGNSKKAKYRNKGKAKREPVVQPVAKPEVPQVCSYPEGAGYDGVIGYTDPVCRPKRKPVEPPDPQINRPDQPDQPVVPARPSLEQVTAGSVRRQVVEVPFPRLGVRIQPDVRSYVNLDTNVYTEPVAFSRVVTVLTWPVQVRATPSSYTWQFGDGSTLTTQSPGYPRPGGDVTHKYLRRFPDKIALRVTVHYTARFRAPGRGWEVIPGDIAVAGPATSLQVCELRPVLTDPDNPAPVERVEDPENPCTQEPG